MYNLPYHKESDQKVIDDFIKKNPFALLSGCDSENRPVATQVPLLIKKRNGKIFLQGHIMKNTDHHKAFEHNPNVLTVFTGKHCYVSGTWYTNPYTASTWNYMSIHAKGVIHFLDGKALEELLQETSLHFENQNQDSETVFANLPQKFKQRVLEAIVAFEIQVSELDTIFKLSQDKDANSYQNIIDHLKTQNEDAQIIAAEMEKRKEKLF